MGSRRDRLKTSLTRKQQVIFVAMLAVGGGFLAASPLSGTYVAEGIAFILVGLAGLLMSWTTFDIGAGIKEVVREEGRKNQEVIREVGRENKAALDSLAASVDRIASSMDRMAESQKESQKETRELITESQKGDAGVARQDVRITRQDVKIPRRHREAAGARAKEPGGLTAGAPTRTARTAGRQGFR